MPRTAKSKKAASNNDNIAIIELTVDEVTHIRNMMSVLLPSQEELTFSQSLLEAAGMNKKIESNLWDKVWEACEKLEIPIGQKAPDFIVGPSGPTPMCVYLLEEEEEE